MKKLSVLIIAVLAITVIAAAAFAADDVKQIGIIQLVEHPALDAAEKGFVDGLAAEGFTDGKNIKIDLQNAQGDQANLETISDRFVKNNVALVLAIATPAAQAIAAKTTTIPILVTAVTDPADARLVESNEKPNTNVSGTTDMQPIQKQLDLLMQLFPDTKTIGIVYNSSEANSELQVKLFKKAAEAENLKIETGTVTSVNDIDQVMSSLIDKVDVIYTPTDNTIASAMPNVVKVAEAAKKPIIGAEPGEVENGALATAGINYYNLGVQTGHMAAKILRGEAEPKDMPIESLDKVDIVLNQTTADAIGFTFPKDLLDSAATVYPTAK